MTIQIRCTTDQDRDVFVSTLHAAFARFPETPNEDGSGVFWSAWEMERNLLATTAQGRPIGTAAAYSFELTLPGGAIAPATGVTNIGVMPSHRRQGVMTAMVRRQFDDVRERGEYLVVLLAMEATIYQRFGYGPATYHHELTVTRHRATFAPARARRCTASAVGTGTETDQPPGSVEVLARAECGELLEQIYDRYRRAQPGALNRPHRWWARGAGHPPVSAAPRYIAVHRDAAGTADDYASYLLEAGTLTVDEIIATDDAVSTALARFALEHDLVHEVVFQRCPLDLPLRWQLADFRAARVSDDGDYLWVRLLDVPRALTSRGWFRDGDLVLDVDDPFLDERDRYLLTVRAGRADCVTTDRAPDLSLDVSDLASIYLGGTLPSTLVRAGHVQAHHQGAAAQADALFRTERFPHCVHEF